MTARILNSAKTLGNNPESRPKRKREKIGEVSKEMRRLIQDTQWTTNRTSGRRQ